MAKKAKTWAHLRNSGTYEKEVVTYSDAVGALRSEYDAQSLDKLLQKWNEWEAEKELLERRTADVNAHIAALSSLAFDRMDAGNYEDLTIGNGHFSRDTDVSAPVTDKVAMLAWFEEHMPDLITVHSSTITSQTKLALKNGSDLPAGIEVKVRDRIKRTSA